MIPMVISHRTSMGSMPENSLAGIRAALAEGAGGVEVDVRATSDGRLVLMHDRSLLRTTGNPCLIDELPASELSAVMLRDHDRPTEPVPTLSAALGAIDGRELLVVDVKQAGIASLLAVELTALRSGAWAWTHDESIAAELRRELPADVPVGLIVGPAMLARRGRESVLRLAARLQLDALIVEAALLDARWTAELRRMGMQCHSGSVVRTEEVLRAARLGVDSVCTDFPRRTLGVLAGMAATGAASSPGLGSEARSGTAVAPPARVLTPS
ncbi:MAG: hypothetical protein GEU80_07585 [Dehalococcoidia bacterium]|nr:hypothetical protein [Dehalococcoidia bacterium]